jgi:hypothetical protein
MPLFALLVWLQVARATENVRLVVIVSASRPTADISSNDLRAIYLGQITRWPNRRAILPVMIPLESPAGRMFLRRVIGMADVDFAQHWIGVVFRGQTASPPLVAGAGEQAARFVAAHPEAIAVLASIPADKNVRVLTVDGKPPEAVDYPLRWSNPTQ